MTHIRDVKSHLQLTMNLQVGLGYAGVQGRQFQGLHFAERRCKSAAFEDLWFKAQGLGLTWRFMGSYKWGL